MATCRFCFGRQEDAKFCWRKNRIMDLKNEACNEYEHIPPTQYVFMEERDETSRIMEEDYD